MMNELKRAILIILSAIVLSTIVQAEEWTVPEDKAKRNSPVLFDAAAIKKGEELFQRNCASCHGMPSKGNNIKSLIPNPPDVATKKVQEQSDGELFYKITVGRGAMPGFKNSISEIERWFIIAYMRSFNKDYVQPPLAKLVDSAKIKALGIIPHFDLKNHKVSFNFKMAQKKDSIPLTDAEVALFVKRYFGNLPIGNIQSTDQSGNVYFDFPKDLPGDSTGNVILVLKVNHEELGEVEQTFKTQLGVPTIKPPLTEKRAMWNVVKKAPIWLLITYILVVAGIWFFIIKVILSLRRLKNAAGQNNEKNNVNINGSDTTIT